uniref:MAT1-2-5 n=1 Tax=Lasiodiplodia gonubiensis TaxID=336252 RepID=A0A343JZS9_9PEZI|nr:MAT1-2-5 [Lasiodiplodia gonubiensis]
MAPAKGFTLNGLQQRISYGEHSELTEQALLDVLRSAVSTLDDSGVLGKNDMASTNATETPEHFPMGRSLTYAVPTSGNYAAIEGSVKRILEAEQDLANHALAMINNDNIAALLQAIGFPSNDTAEQKFRKRALKRVALRQLLTESTDAALRGLGLVQIAEHHRTLLSTRMSEPLWRLLYAARLGFERKWNSQRRKQNNNLLLEELFQVGPLNGVELEAIRGIMKYPMYGLKEWFKLRTQRLAIAFMCEDLQTPSRVGERLRLLQALKLLMRAKHPQPDWWPMPLMEVAQNNRGTSTM